jgi:hypothetical protein
VPQLAEHHRVRPIDEHRVDPGGALARHVVLADQPEVVGHAVAGAPVADPRHGLRIVAVGPVQPPVHFVGVQLRDLLRIAGGNPAQELVDSLSGVHGPSLAR